MVSVAVSEMIVVVGIIVVGVVVVGMVAIGFRSSQPKEPLLSVELILI